MRRNTKKCVICGKDFFCRPSRNVITCSPECRKIRASQVRKGSKRNDESRHKMSEIRKNNPDNAEMQKKATEAAKISPISGRFVTNRAAIDWHLVSPDGEHYYIHSLTYWLRENCNKYFGVEPDSKQFFNVISGLSRVKKSVLGTLPKGQRPGYTYKGWKVIPTEADKKQKKEERTK